MSFQIQIKNIQVMRMPCYFLAKGCSVFTMKRERERDRERDRERERDYGGYGERKKERERTEEN